MIVCAPMHAPGEAPSPGRLEELVLLGVEEVRDRQPRHLLAQRGLQLGFRVVLERPEVMLQAGDEGDVPEALGRIEGGEQVPHQGAVHRAILLLGRPADPGRDENVGGVDAGERRPERLQFKQIGRDGSNAGDAALRLAGDAMDLPTFGDKMLSQIAPYQAGHSGDDCSQCHGVSPYSKTFIELPCNKGRDRLFVRRAPLSHRPFEKSRTLAISYPHDISRLLETSGWIPSAS